MNADYIFPSERKKNKSLFIFNCLFVFKPLTAFLGQVEVSQEHPSGPAVARRETLYFHLQEGSTGENEFLSPSSALIDIYGFGFFLNDESFAPLHHPEPQTSGTAAQKG